MSTPSTYGPAGDQDATEAYLFRCDTTGRHAVSRERSGGNLPTPDGGGAWSFVQQIAVGVHEALPIPGDPEPVLRGLLEDGYYVWPRGGSPHGTSQ